MIQLLNGDCLELMKTLPDASIDCFICDLPYGQLTGISKEKATKKRYINGEDTGTLVEVKLFSGCAWDIKIDLEAFWKQVERLARNDNTPVIHFCNTKFGIDLINSKPSWFRYDLVWNKERGVSFLLANKQPMKSHEMIYVFAKKGAYYKRVDVKTDKGSYISWGGGKGIAQQYGAQKTTNNNERGKDGMRCPTSVITMRNSNCSKGTGHPTEKPIELYKWLLERYCPANGTVLDPTAGSFNSIWASAQLGLNGIGIEMDKTFFDKAIDRITEDMVDA